MTMQTQIYDAARADGKENDLQSEPFQRVHNLNSALTLLVGTSVL